MLFVCRQNACRSQMAEAFARAAGREAVEIWSAGSTPSGTVDAGAVAVMREVGLELAGHRSKGVDQLPVRRWDVVVLMGCGDACPTVDATHRVAWEVPDPSGKPLEAYRRVRDHIKDAVQALLEQLPALTAR